VDTRGFATVCRSLPSEICILFHRGERVEQQRAPLSTPLLEGRPDDQHVGLILDGDRLIGIERDERA
jgi:hypothetical protein